MVILCAVGYGPVIDIVLITLLLFDDSALFYFKRFS